MDIGSQYEINYQVQSTDLASNLSLEKEDNFPEVFATSRMIALMELAAARLMKPLLKEGELSVGVNVTVDHLAATPNNTQIRAIATYLGQESKVHKFKVELFDQGGLAGGGTHTRAIIKTARLLQGAHSRVTN